MFFRLFDNYKYHNSPDGTEPIEKVIATSKYGLIAGLVAGGYECAMNTAVDGPKKAINCMAFYVIPATAIAGTFSAVTYMSTKIRGKDGPLNYAIGAMASSTILYKITKLPVFTLAWGIAGVIAAASYKHAKDLNLDIFPFAPTYLPQHDTILGDFTISKERRPWKN